MKRGHLSEVQITGIGLSEVALLFVIRGDFSVLDL